MKSIDTGSQETADKQVQGILSTTKTADRGKVLESLKNYGMVTESSSIEGGVTATSGEQFLKGKAQSAAATMSKDDRLSFGGYSYNMATDSTTGETRVESTNSSGVTTGNYVHDKSGIRVDNPVQMMIGKAGADTIDAYTGPDVDGDGSADGMGAAAGGAAMGIVTASTVAGGYALANGKNKRVDRAFASVGHKLKGHVEGIDPSGKGGAHYSQENWEKLEKNGMAQKGEDGKWGLSEDRAKAKSFIETQPSSTGTVTNNQTSTPTTPTATPTKAAVNMETPSNKLDKVNENTLSEPNYNENTKRSQIIRNKSKIQ